MKKVLVYGGCGFIGSALVRYLISNNIDVIVVEKPGTKTSEKFNRIKEYDINYLEVDLKDSSRIDDLIPEKDIDVLFQLAWSIDTREKLLDYKEQIECVYNTLELIKVAKRLNCKTFVGAGSMTEQELCSKEGRNNASDKHKYYRTAQFTVSNMGRVLAKEMGIRFFWPQITNIYGPGEISDRLINSIIRRISNKESFIMSTCPQLYDFIYIDDAVKAFYLIAEKGEEDTEYLIGSGNARILKEYIKELEMVVCGSDEYVQFENPYEGVFLTENDLSINNLKKLGFFAETSFGDGIRKMI